MNKTLRRIPELDIARAVAVIAIIIYHTGMVFGEPAYPGAGMPPAVGMFLDTFHLYTLFIVSGYLTNFNTPLSAALVRKSARGTLLPYLVACLFIIGGAAFWALAKQADPADQALRWFLASCWGAGSQHPLALVQVERIGGIWFLLALFWAKLFIGATARLSVRGKMLAMTAGLVSSILSARYIWLPLSIQSGIAASAFMYVGWLLRTYRARLDRWNVPITLISLLCWAAAILHGGNSSLAMCAFPAGLIDILGGIGSSWCILRAASFVARHIHGVSTVLEMVGRNTLPLFVMHIVEDNTLPVGELIQTYIATNGLHPWSWAVLACCRVLFDALLAGLLFLIPWTRRIFFPHSGTSVRQVLASFWSTLKAESSLS